MDVQTQTFMCIPYNGYPLIWYESTWFNWFNDGFSTEIVIIFMLWYFGTCDISVIKLSHVCLFL